MKGFFDRLFVPPGLISREIRLLIAEKAITFKSETTSVTGDRNLINLLRAPLLFAFWIDPCTQHNHSNTKLKVHALCKLIHTSGQCFSGVSANILDQQ